MTSRSVLRAALLVLASAAASGAVSAQAISNLEAGRPISIEDPLPVARGAFTASADYAYARRLDGVEYAGPALSILYGVYQNLEMGAETRLLTNPRLNARRGIGSGDIDLHALGTLCAETERRPSVGLRADVILPTGLASHGTDFLGEALVTKSFDRARVHGNFGDLYVGDPRQGARRNRLFAAAGIDFLPFGVWNTDTLGMADVVLRQSVQSGGNVSVGLELGIKHRIGIQTVFYAGLSTEVAGEPDRVRYRGLLGLTHAF